MDFRDINVDTFINIKATIKEHEGPEIELHVKLISMLFNLTEDEVLDLPLTKFEDYERQTAFLYRQPKLSAKIPNVIVLNGRKYNVVKNAKKLTASQFIDYMTYCKLPDPDSHLAQVLSVFLIPDGEKYGSYDIEHVINEISTYLSAQMALEIAFFLRLKSLHSLTSTVRYLELMMWMMKRRAKKNPKVKEKMEEVQEKLRMMVMALERSEDEYISLTK